VTGTTGGATNRDVDLIVVGGGPVGLAAAIEARLAGLTVTVVEPRTSAIDKACGEGLMPGAIPLLERLGVNPRGFPLLGVSYRSADRHVDHLFRVGQGRGVRRTVLHAALAERAEQLGVGSVAEKVKAIEQNADGVSAAGLTAGWLFGCDGLHSSVRRMTGLEVTRRVRSERFGLRQHFFVEPWSDLIEVHWNKRVEAYVTPVSDSVVGISLLGPKGTDFRTELETLSELNGHIASSETASSLRGAGPFLQRAKRPSSGRVLLVGDASGYVDAITGEGLRLGFAQARAAVESIVAKRPQSYDSEWRRITRDFRRLTAGLVRAARSPVRGAIVPVAAALPGVYGAIVERLAR
jgi:menaquinone-9 beta-reductase